MAKIVELIYTTRVKGRGLSIDDSMRVVHEFWTKEGELVCEIDSLTQEFNYHLLNHNSLASKPT